MGQRKVWWSDFSAAEFEGLDPHRTIAILPLAAIEQHGPHLPLGTDSILNTGCLQMLAAHVPDDLDVRILPLQQVGKSNEHIWAKGTLSHSPGPLIESWTELGLSVHRAGISKIVLVNAHGGNEEIMGIVARELRVRAGMLAVKTSWTRFQPPAGLLSEEERRLGIHGGDLETSLMLHFRPELVDMSKARDFASVAAENEGQFQYLRPTGTHAWSWIASDLNPAGVVGNAAAATAEKGRQIAETEVAGMLALLQEVAAISLPG